MLFYTAIKYRFITTFFCCSEAPGENLSECFAHLAHPCCGVLWKALREDSNSINQFTCSGVVLRHPVILECHGVRWVSPPQSAVQSIVRLSLTSTWSALHVGAFSLRKMYSYPTFSSTLPWVSGMRHIHVPTAHILFVIWHMSIN